MTTHVVCLDGTGQVRTKEDPTNIALIFDAMGGTITEADYGSFESSLTTGGRVVQVGKYLPGVGTKGPALLKLLDQSVGNGIAEPIVRGYTFLSRRYQPGDEIIILGFSRGAAAARCLAGFVVGQGLLNPRTYDPGDKDEAYLRGVAAWYLHRAGEPHLAKAANMLDVMTALGKKPPKLDKADFVEVERIKAVGVFDTVCSLGIPHPDANGWVGYDFGIANTELNKKVLNGFHALAADEIRANFAPTFWTPRENVVQTIFPGCHSDIGGGYPETGLSDRTLQWMLRRLGGQGLRYELSNIRDLAPDARGDGHDGLELWLWQISPKAPRIFPIDLSLGEPAFSIDQSLRERWGQVVRLLPGGSRNAYAALGLYAGPKPLYVLEAGAAPANVAFAAAPAAAV